MVSFCLRHPFLHGLFLFPSLLALLPLSFSFSFSFSSSFSLFFSLFRWIWANWASVLKYVLTVRLINEFEGKKFDKCDSDEEYCSFENGDQVLEFYNADASLKWPYIAVTFGFAVVFAIICYFAVRFCRYEKR